MPLKLVDRQWNWIDDGVLPYALSAMRAVWIWLLFHLAARALTPTRGDWIALPTVFGLLAVSTLFAQLGSFRVKNDLRAGLLVAVGGLVAVLVAIYLAVGAERAALWDMRWVSAAIGDPALALNVLVVAVWLWRWGILTGREWVSYDVFSFDFTLGVLAFVVALSVAFGTGFLSVGELIAPLLLFFAIGLGTLALSSLQSARNFEGQRTGQSIALNSYWLGTIGAIIGAVLLGGLVLAQLFAPESLSGILSLLAVLWDLLVRVLYVILVVVSFVIFAVLEFLARLLPPLQVSSRQQAPELPASPIDQLKELQTKAVSPSPELYFILQVIAGALMVVVIALIFMFAFRRFGYLDREGVEETHETVFSFDLLKEQLGQLFRRKGNPQVPVAPFVSVTGDDPRAQIRRTYQALLAWATARGIPRAPGQTPTEYGGALTRAWDSYREPISLITVAYLRARYSTAEISAARAGETARAWEQITRADDQTEKRNVRFD